MISKLKFMTESKLDATIYHAAVTKPRLPGLSHADFDEAIEYAGIHLAMSFDEEPLEACPDSVTVSDLETVEL